jgi:AcrR family transcriptional regulator
MARRRPDDKFQQILETAAAVFIDQGYRRTQMADVAAAMGVAKGTLYLYVESKEALFDAVLRYLDSDVPLPSTLPISTPRPEETLQFVGTELARKSDLPSLAAALARRQVRDIGEELSTILFDLYDVLARNRRRLKILDRSAREYPEIAALWLEGGRGGILALLETYLKDRIRRGHIVGSGDLGTTTRLVLETIVFWAVHRHWDLPPATAASSDVDDASVRETVVQLLVRSLVKPKAERPMSKPKAEHPMSKPKAEHPMGKPKG